MEDNFVTPRQNRRSVLDRLEEVRTIILGVDDNVVLVEAKAALDALLKEHRTRSQVFLVAVAQQRIDIITRLARSVTRVMDSLEGVDLDGRSADQLVDILDTMTKVEQRYVEFVSKVADGGMPEEMPDNTTLKELEDKMLGYGVDPGTVRSRRRVMSLLSRMTDKFSEGVE